MTSWTLVTCVSDPTGPVPKGAPWGDTPDGYLVTYRWRAPETGTRVDHYDVFKWTAGDTGSVYIGRTDSLGFQCLVKEGDQIWTVGVDSLDRSGEPSKFSDPYVHP